MNIPQGLCADLQIARGNLRAEANLTIFIYEIKTYLLLNLGFSQTNEDDCWSTQGLVNV